MAKDQNDNEMPNGDTPGDALPTNKSAERADGYSAADNARGYSTIDADTPPNEDVRNYRQRGVYDPMSEDMGEYRFQSEGMDRRGFLKRPVTSTER